MNNSTTNLTSHFTASASLAVIGMKLRQLDLLAPIRTSVQIPQKTVKDTPFEKVSDAFTNILAGGAGTVEVNTRLRSDRALQLAFGRHRCAEQSVIQQTLSACTAETVHQMEQAMDEIYRQHSHGYQHNYHQEYQILDVDLTGLPRGRESSAGHQRVFCRSAQSPGKTTGSGTRYALW